MLSSLSVVSFLSYLTRRLRLPPFFFGSWFPFSGVGYPPPAAGGKRCFVFFFFFFFFILDCRPDAVLAVAGDRLVPPPLCIHRTPFFQVDPVSSPLYFFGLLRVPPP